MSYILNALRKAEQARQSEHIQNLKSSILNPPQQPEYKRGLLITLILCNAIVILLLFLYLWQSESSLSTRPESAYVSVPPSDAGQRVVTETPSQIPSADSPKPIAKHVMPAKKTLPSIADMLQKQQLRKPSEASLETTASKAHDVEHGDHVHIVDVEKKSKPALRTSQSSGKYNMKQIIPTAPNRNADVLAKLKKSLPTQVGTEGSLADHPLVKQGVQPRPMTEQNTKNIRQTQTIKSQYNSPSKFIPLLDELPSSFRRTVPKLAINVYVYSEDTRERFIIVDMARYTEGQRITGGLFLKQIRPDDIVVTFSGKTFRIKRP